MRPTRGLMCRNLGLITVSTPFRRVGKVIRNYSVCMGIRWQITFFPKLNFTKFLNRNVKIVFTKFEGNSLARRRSVLLIFPIFYTFACVLFPANRVYQAKFKNKCMEIRKN